MGFSRLRTLESLTLILLSSFMISPPLVAASITVDDPQQIALLSFKSLLSDPQQSLSSWNNKSLHSYCTSWRGVTCGRRHPMNVVALDLDSLGLSGPISPSVSNLTFLTRLHLSDNQLRGSIPEEIGRLSHLRSLNLSTNLLQGEIPANLSQCSQLRRIILTHNVIGGEIPGGIGSLPMLEALNLGANNLIGHIPLLLGSNPSLTDVQLWNNSLKGGIPSFLANCTTLRILDIQGNYLTGAIPASITNNPSLFVLDLQHNNLTGSIPQFSVNQSQLMTVALNFNQLTGSIPPSLGNLSSLEYLYLASNELEGSIPDSLSNIPFIKYLELTKNRLSNIPSSLYNLSTVLYFGVGYNALSGTLPQDMGITLPNLQSLGLFGNGFTGPIPVSLSNASGLEVLDLGENLLSGEVPSNLGSLGYLRELILGENQLQTGDWSFLSSLSNCSFLEKLYLENNNLAGELPRSIGNLSAQLLKLDLGNSKISGIIPTEIGNLVGLIQVSMEQNLLVGSIPATIGKLRNLYGLYLDKNKLSGPIPSAIGNLAQLNELDLSGNELNGTIPAAIGGCKSLSELNLSHNSLGGSIPKELLTLSTLSQFLDLSHNYLNGSVPVEIGLLINLGILDVSENRLSGDIPTTLDGCQHLEQLHMEGNFFQGSIPQSFVHLKSLNKLDLSRNNLSGEIPDFLEAFGSLKSLNLSFNNFEGEVPSRGVFSNASEISLTGNKKLCGGDPKLRLPDCSTHSANHRITSHVKVIIAVAGSFVILLFLSSIGILIWQRRKQRDPPPAASFEGDMYMKISYAALHKATDGFSSANLVGAGAFGSVYKGKIDPDEVIVAVKVLNLDRKGASRSFIVECEALKNIRHRNLVKIITACSSLDSRGNDFKALVFEYMPNGSLERWLHPDDDLEVSHQWKLTLIQRLDIALDMASALDYLHHYCEPPVVHCDLKPSNILLDNNMTAHVGDFGIARLLLGSSKASTDSTNSLMGIKGTVGYVAPEYAMGTHVSTKGDVYSFGVLLLEMLTGKKPTDDMFKEGLNLRKYAEMALLDDVMKVMDPLLVPSEESTDNNKNSTSRSRCIISLVRVGLTCSSDTPRERMEMKDVSAELHKIKDQFND